MDSYAGRRRGCRNLTDVQDELARRLEARAGRLRAEAGRDGGDGLSVVEAVALAAVQLGLQPPAPTAGGRPRNRRRTGSLKDAGSTPVRADPDRDVRVGPGS
ncbi:hypothetical protein [Streptomyces sp. NPDC060010]|uniref:hypothetical protein n=1 Tax=Streptomyces sp. NPDC060010 TaxID=3347036 RepID=UPI003692635D